MASVLSGFGVVAGAALCLAGSEDASTPGPPPAAAGQQRVPVLWPEPVLGQPPRAFAHVASAGHNEAPARRKLPLAWAAVANLIVAAVLLGAAAVLLSWPIAVGGVALGVVGSAMAARSHILADVSLGQSPEGP